MIRFPITRASSAATRIAAIACTILLAQSSAAQEPSTLVGYSPFGYDTEATNGTFLRVDAAYNATALLRSDGRVFCHGSGSISDLPPPPSGLRYVDIAVSGTSIIALLSDGSVVRRAWETALETMALPALPPGVVYRDVAAGGCFVALRSDGQVDVFGNIWYGEDQVPPLPPGLVYTKVEAGSGRAMAIRSDGQLLAWGLNNMGQCNVPPLPAGMSYVAARAGFRHTLALRSDGQIVAFGNNADGQCNVPALPAGVTYTQVAAGNWHSIALRSDGQFVGWGSNWQINPLNLTTAPALPRRTSIAQIACGWIHCVVLLSNGKVLGWGNNNVFAAFLPGLPPGERWTQVSVGDQYTLAVRSDGALIGFGVNTFGQCDPPPLPPGVRYVQAAGGYMHSAALRSDGQVVCFGDNAFGRCNVLPLPPGLTYTKVVVSDTHTLALRSNGTVVGWGENSYGQCIAPMNYAGMYIDIDADHMRSMLLRFDGEIVLKGLYQSGPNAAEGVVPVLPTGMRYVEIAAGQGAAGALRSDGEVVEWPAAAIRRAFPTLPWGVYYVEIDSSADIMIARRSDGLIEYSAHGTIDPRYQLPDAPPLLPGTSYVEISSTLGQYGAARVGPTSTYVAYGHGCAGSRPASRLVPMDTPRIGREHVVHVLELPQNVAFVVFGWNRIQPLALDPHGMPGCALHVSQDGVALVVGQDGWAKSRLPIPNDPTLVGLRYHQQALILDSGANTLGAVVSDAAEGVIGHW